MQRLFLLLAFLSFPLFIYPNQKERCIPENFAFHAGEEIEMNIYYNWGVLWVNAGLVKFTVGEKYFRDKKVFHLTGTGRTHRRYDWMYRVRDYFQSYVDVDTFKPLWHEMDTYEGGFIAKDEYFFFPERDEVFIATENSDRPKTTTILSIPPCSFDIITALYIARNMDFKSIGINNPIPFNILISDKLHNLNPRFLGTEVVTTREGESYRCMKFSIELVPGFIFKPGDEMFVWVTDDNNRIPVMVEAQIRVGSIKAMLISANGLRNASNARIN